MSMFSGIMEKLGFNKPAPQAATTSLAGTGPQTAQTAPSPTAMVRVEWADIATAWSGWSVGVWPRCQLMPSLEIHALPEMLTATKRLLPNATP